MKKEVIWKDVKGFEGAYKINSEGEIWRIIITGCDTFEKVRRIGLGGQKIVVLSKTTSNGAIEKAYNVKTLIYDTFNEGRKHTLKFKDGNPKNLCPSNLIEDKKRLTTNGNKQLDNSHIKIMKRMRKDGMSYKKIGEFVGCSDQTVRNYLKKQ